jgi:hypothetical protein
MLPGEPGVEDYDSRIYDEFWEAVIERRLPPWRASSASSADART